jgi:hypothetical protein
MPMSEERPAYEELADQVRRQLPAAQQRGHSQHDCCILLDKETGEVKPTDLLGLCAWRSCAEEAGEDPMRIALDHVRLPGGRVGTVSTVFLGVDHGPRRQDPPAPPILFETMVRGESDHAGKASKACTVTQARDNHARWLRVLQAEAAGLQSPEARADPGLEELFGLLGLLLQAPPPEENNARHE